MLVGKVIKLKKIIIIGVICLFVCVGFQSAFANDLSISMVDDITPPIVKLTYEFEFNQHAEWRVIFTALCMDINGIDRVEFTCDGALRSIDYLKPYECNILFEDLVGRTICAVAYDKFGNSASDCVYFRSCSADIENIKTEDCDCKQVSDIDVNKLDMTINRIEGYTILLSLYSKHNTKYKAINEKLSNKVSLIQEKYQELKKSDIYQICNFYLFLNFIGMSIVYMIKELPLFLQILLYGLHLIGLEIQYISLYWGFTLNCWWW